MFYANTIVYWKFESFISFASSVVKDTLLSSALLVPYWGSLLLWSTTNRFLDWWMIYFPSPVLLAWPVICGPSFGGPTNLSSVHIVCSTMDRRKEYILVRAWNTNYSCCYLSWCTGVHHKRDMLIRPKRPFKVLEFSCSWLRRPS